MTLPRSVLPALVSVLALVACGDGADRAPTASSGAPATPASPTAAATGSAADPTPDAAGASDVRFFGDGIDLPERVVVFGDVLDDVLPDLTAALGAPTADTGPTDPFSAYGTCPGSTLRVVELLGGSVRLFAGDVDVPTPDGSTAEAGDDLVLYAWELADEGPEPAAAQARALVGDVTTVDLGVGDLVTDLEAELGEAFEAFPAEGPFPPSFDVRDQSSGLSGVLSEDGEQVTLVSAGQTCGE